MSKKPYLIDAVIGNSKLLVSMYKDGQISRIWWPSIDLHQHADEIFDGVYIKEKSEMLWRSQGKWEYSQQYIENTNVIKSEAVHLEHNIKIESIDFCTPEEDIIVKKYIIKNNNPKPLNLKFIFKSGFAMADSSRYNSVYFNKENEALVHYKQDYVFALGASEKIDEYTVSNVMPQVEFGKLDGSDVSQGKEGALLFNLREVNKGEERTVTIFIVPGRNKEESLKLLEKAKEKGVDVLYYDTVKYWNEYIKQGNNVKTGNEELDQVYVRSLLTLALMYSKETGGFLAAPECDEDMKKCGGYGFCWPRDGAFIANTMLKAGYYNISKKFYKWAVKVQEKAGFWDQRYYMNGLKAPTWGVQIDETGSILWSMYEYFKKTEDYDFLREIWISVFNAAEFLCKHIDNETNLPTATMDLWEERKGEHTYSSAAVEAGLRGAAKIAHLLGYKQFEEKWMECSRNVKRAIENTLWNDEKQSFYRGIKYTISKKEYEKIKDSNIKVYSRMKDEKYKEYIKYYDDIVDSSLLGISYPFKTLNAKNEKMIKQGKTIEKYLWVNEVGGIKRYEDDIYIGGNPWIITTLWLAIYYNSIGCKDKAEKLVQWVLNHRTYLDLLPEQIDKESGETAWVVPLAWSHAMFILSIIEIYDIKND